MILEVLWELTQAAAVAYSLWQTRAWKSYWLTERESLSEYMNKKFHEVANVQQALLEKVQGHKKDLTRWASAVNKALDL
jgi:hypothetical protein